MLRSAIKIGRLFIFAGGLTAMFSAARAGDGLAPIRIDPSVLRSTRELQLAVTINSVPTGLVKTFDVDPQNGRISVRARDLRDLGIKVPSQAEVLCLDDLPDLRFAYDEPSQTIDFKLRDDQRLPKTYDASRRGDREKARSDIGFLMNYSLFGSGSAGRNLTGTRFDGANATLDTRAVSPVGVLSQTSIVGVTPWQASQALRLATTYTFADDDRAVRYQVGDVTNGSLPWTRAIRMGGLQMQRDFTLQPDLVTIPLPQFSGSAAVPSSVDVFVNGRKSYTQDVAPGPFSLTNLPVLGANGTADVVVRDATGREVHTTLSLFDAAKLLAPSLTSFSVEAGLPRYDYGLRSDEYGKDPVASATLRHGFTDWFTSDLHAEGNSRLLNGGLGADVRLASYGILSLAASGSSTSRREGARVDLSYALQTRYFSLTLSSDRTFRDYADLVSVTARQPLSVADLATPLAQTDPLQQNQPPRSVDRASISTKLPGDFGSLSFAFARIVAADGQASRFGMATFSRNLFHNVSFSLNAYVDTSTTRDAGVFASLSVPFGDVTTSLTAETTRANGWSTGTYAQKAQSTEQGSYGWRLHDAEGSGAGREASGSYRMSAGQVGATLQQTGAATFAQATFDGSVALMRGGIDLGNKSDDGFAIVDAGMPGIPILQDNRVIGETGGNGRFLVPNLRSYQANRISIDPTKLPVNAGLQETDASVVPSFRGGIYVDFGGKPEDFGAVIVIVDGSGKPLPPGLKGRVDGGEDFVVGYDGRTYAKGLAPQNSLVVDLGDHECHAAFQYEPNPQGQTIIRDVTCK